MQSDDVAKEPSSEEEETVLEQQVEKSTVELLTLTHEGKELISNVRVAADAHEVKRRADQAAAKEARIKKLEEEANLAQQKFNQINSKWENITLLNDPLDLHQETESQREKCIDLITQKDKLIEELKAELKAGDIRFVKDQQKQAEDIGLLVERIDNQITIMRRAYRRELVLIEEAIDIEREETMDINNMRWQALYKQREDNEIFNLEQRFVALSEHNNLMHNIMVHHQEKFRATKISLEKDIQVLQQQLEQVKAICLLNKEKMEYNYQVLKKRDEESLLIRSQQKRRINKLQDIVTTLRRKLMQMEQSTQAEVKRLTSEVIKLHRNIKDIQLKAEHFCSVNETKYFQLWKFNHDSAQKLLDKICSIDRLVHEQQLGIKWRPVGTVSLTRQNLPSYKAAIERRDSGTLEGGQRLQGHSGSTDNERLLQHILEAVADRSGFLVEDRLTVLLAPYTRSQNTLVRIDNVFSALGVTRPEDIELLRQTMEPYIVCVTCQPLLEAVHPISPPASPPPSTPTEDELKVRVMKKFQDTLEEGEKITQKKQEKSEEEILSPDDQKVSTMTGDSSSVTPWVTLSAIEIPDHSFMSIYPSSVHEDVDINNRYEVLEDVDDSVDEDSADEVEEKINTAHSVAKSTDKRNLLICADSHGRDLAWHLNAVQGTHEAVVINVKEDNLSKSDTLVVICGSNDVAKNEADNFLEILHKTLNETKDNNVVLVDLPIRYDLANWSCVNKEVVKTNKRLKELSEQFSNVSLVRASDAVRQLHTRHGQHLNHKGKRWLSNMIAETVASSQMGIRRSQGPKEDQRPAPGTEYLLENYSLLETTVNI
ncbi:DNA replication checkpoint protein Drc1 [Homalodisca vitripennis]|nr:DNA replication checkpoint protein Drc1 [Homalodisca vitripennis]